MNMMYHWQVQPMAETKPIDIYTTTDSVAAAAVKYEEQEGTAVSIRYIRKIATIDKIDYSEYDATDWQVS